jgi:hypothetical protein
MKKILNSPLEGRYNNADHVEFNKLSYDICERSATAIAAPALITSYRDKVLQEENIYKWMRKSEFTEKKAEADHARDRALTGMLGIVRTNMKHFDPAIRDNATHVYNLLSNYGDLTRAGYDAETAGIESIVARLTSADYLPAVQNLGLMPWITELEAQNALFKSYVGDVSQEQIEKPTISQRVARQETDVALQHITTRVTALVHLNGVDDYAVFVTEFNVLVNHYNTLLHEHYGRLHSRTDITPAVIAPIAPQPYTGKPVYVIPAVTLAKTAKDGSVTEVELVFSVDYTVSYRSNINPGTATLIITGIGLYTGEIVTTFNINS